MDLDDLDEPIQAPSRVAKFAPKASKLKPQPKPKPEASQESVSAPKPEPQNLPIPKRSEDEIDDKPSGNAASSSNGAVKMEIDSNSELAAAAAAASSSSPKQEDGTDVDGEEQKQDEDTVVREIDVFFTPSVDDNTRLYVMQYPLRACWRPYELDERCEEVRVKPTSGEVEIDLSLDVSTNWNSDFADRHNVKKQTLSTTWQPLRATGYAVGVLIGNKLHLNPIHAVVQLRPSLEHLRSYGSKRKMNITSDAEYTVKVENPSEGKPVGSSKKQNKRVDPSNEKKLDVEECWVPLKYHGSRSDLSSSYLQKMVAKETSPLEFAMSPYNYISSLCPGTSDGNARAKVLSRRFLLSLPLEERVKRLLLEGPPIQHFDALKHYCLGVSSDDVFTILQKYSQLVQGLWVPKTSLLYPNATPKENIKLAARDYVLILFHKNRLIESSKLNFPVKFKEEMKSFLNIFAIERASFKDWEFKERTDKSFLQLYPEIVQKQDQLWKDMEQKISHFLQPGKSMPGAKTAVAKPGVTHNVVRSLNSEKSTIKGTSGVLKKKTITDETCEALLKALPKVFQNHKVCSLQLICEGLRDLAIHQSTLPKGYSKIAVTAASGVADAPPEELQEVISEVATDIHGFYVLKSSPEHPEYDSLRKVVIDLLLARGPNAKLKKAEVFEAARLALRRDVNNNEYTKVMTDFCETKGSSWVLKSGDGKPV